MEIFMNTIKDIYINSLLSDAVYTKVSEAVNSGSTVLRDIVRERMTASQAQFITDNVEVIAALEKSNLYQSGFAAVWKGRVGTSYEGKLFRKQKGCLKP